MMQSQAPIHLAIWVSKPLICRIKKQSFSEWYAHLHDVKKPRSNLPLLESSTREIQGWILNSYSDHIWWLTVRLVFLPLCRKVILPEPLQFSWQGPFLHHLPSAKLLARWDPIRVLLLIDPVWKDRVSSKNQRKRKTAPMMSLTCIQIPSQEPPWQKKAWWVSRKHGFEIPQGHLELLSSPPLVKGSNIYSPKDETWK